MNLLLILLPLWLITTAHSVLFNVHLWQLKEYRLDRLVDYFRTARGKRLLIQYGLGITVTIISFIPLWLSLKGYAEAFPSLSLAAFALLAFLAFRQLRHRWLKRPDLTFKAIIAVVGVFGILGLWLLIQLWQSGTLRAFQGEIRGFSSGEILNLSIFLVLTRLLVPLVVPVALFLIYVPSEIVKRMWIRRATTLRAAIHPKHVIGVTGSYGKTSTTTFLETILATKWPVFKPRGGTNINAAIAEQILARLDPDHELLVIEMGAYQDGEIARICEMVKPDIGIWTAVNEQHLGLFGSIEGTMRAKYELIAALPKNGVAIINGDDERVVSKTAAWPGRKVVFSQKARSADIYASDIQVESERLCFTVHFGGKQQPFVVNLIGAHNVGNLLAAIAGALEAGMTVSEIAAAARRIRPLEGTFNISPGMNGTVLIDSTFSSNPAGVCAALAYLRIFEDKRKVMVFPGIIELGQASDRIHVELGQAIAETCDFLVIPNDDFVAPLLEGVRSRRCSQIEVLHGRTTTQILLHLRNLTGPDVVMLFEGRGTSHLYRGVGKEVIGNL